MSGSEVEPAALCTRILALGFCGSIAAAHQNVTKRKGERCPCNAYCGGIAIDGALLRDNAYFFRCAAAAANAFLQPSESCSFLSCMHWMMRPPPGCTPAQSVRTSAAHAVRTDPAGGDEPD